MSAQYKRPESVLVVVYTCVGEVLVLRRVQPADFWQSVTGCLEWDEAPMQAASRELYEETGLHATLEDSAEPGAQTLILSAHPQKNCFPILPAWRSRYAPDVDHNIEHVFSLCLKNAPEIRLRPEEHTEYQWLARDAAIEKVTSWTNKKAIDDIVPVI